MCFLHIQLAAPQENCYLIVLERPIIGYLAAISSSDSISRLRSINQF